MDDFDDFEDFQDASEVQYAEFDLPSEDTASEKPETDVEPENGGQKIIKEMNKLFMKTDFTAQDLISAVHSSAKMVGIEINSPMKPKK
ncbi:hypothetical protein AYI68_g8220 [Smittium mucronatum]|uniref:Uncharacterized protein n=1 Tax=Smittium mucronatum TaxID=133383 RepID=A0A1R0GLI2_9FUNG|nr:hypothetical protein AYI68_g8220 [Smittium mucronatum]